MNTFFVRAKVYLAKYNEETDQVEDVGYTILVADCLILCGTNRDTYFKHIDDIKKGKTRNLFRQYKSVKVLLNNVGNHLSSPRFSKYDHSFDYYFDEMKKVLINNGFKCKIYYSDYDYRADFNKDAIQFLIDKGYIKILKISQELKLEEN